MMGSGWFVLVLALALMSVCVAVALAIGQGTGEQAQGRAHDTLRQRLAAGEIGPDEYHELAELLGPDRSTSSPLRRWLPALLAVAVALLLLGLLLVCTGRPGGGWWGPMDGRMGGHMDGRRDQRTSHGVAPDAAGIRATLTVAAP